MPFYMAYILRSFIKRLSNIVFYRKNIYNINKKGFLIKYLIVTDLINRIVQVLKGDLYWVKISARDMELIKLVKP